MTTGRPLLYLASHSPRRRELLRQINVRFETLLLRSDRMRGSDVEEIVRAGEAPTDYVTRITLEKARMGAARARDGEGADGGGLGLRQRAVLRVGKQPQPEAVARAGGLQPRQQRCQRRQHRLLRLVPDADGDCSISVVFFMETEELAKQVAAKLQASGMRATNSIPDRHFFNHWHYVLEKRSSDLYGHPWTDAARPCQVEYSQDMCPQSADYLSRHVNIALTQSMSEAHVDSCIRVINHTLSST
jgi:hypothetical protein